MALYPISFNFFDEDGHDTPRTWYVEAANIGAAEVRARTIMQLLIPVLVGAVQQEFTIAQKYVLAPSFFKQTPELNSDVEQLAVYKLRHSINKTGDFTIPGFDKDVYTIPGGDIDRSDPDIVAIETELLTGGWADYRGGDYTAVIKAEEGWA